MKKIITIAALILSVVFTASAVDITKVAKVKPTDEMFMDMAVTAANKSVASNNAPTGAVIILNGAWKATGIPETGKTAEQVAVEKSRLSSLRNATIFTVAEPTTEVINMLNSKGVDAIYFAIPRAKVIEKKVYPAEAYNDEEIDTDVKQAPLMQITFAEAEALYK